MKGTSKKSEDWPRLCAAKKQTKLNMRANSHIN